MELEKSPEVELEELTQIYIKKGLTESLAKDVALQLTMHNALEAHARDELGINDISQAKPLQAAFASALAFLFGGMLPFLVAIFAPLEYMVYLQYGFAILFLAISGTLAAHAGGSNILKSIAHICIWGTIAMAASALVGYLFDVNIASIMHLKQILRKPAQEPSILCVILVYNKMRNDETLSMPFSISTCSP